MADVTDPNDTRVLIPRVRRALEGPAGAGMTEGELSDDEINALVADAIAGVILYGGDLFGHTLEVVERDTTYLAPIAWRTAQEITLPEQTLIAAQAALDYFYNSVVGVKTSQTIRKADREWSWTSSAQVVSDRLRQLREDRDKALQAVAQVGHTDSSWVSFIEARDAKVSALIEPYIDGGSSAGGQLLDARGFG